MRHPAVFMILLTLSSACTACASMPRGTSAACQRANAATLADRIADPCGFADALAECVGLPQTERDRIADRCHAEQLTLRSAESAQGTNCQE